MKILPVGAELDQWDGRRDGRQTDRHYEANSCFSQFSELAKKV
jgi:hypothetical protein